MSGTLDTNVLHQSESTLHQLVKQWKLDTNMPLLFDSYDSLRELEADMQDFNGVPHNIQVISNDKSIELFGKNNQDRYNSMKHDFLVKQSDHLIRYQPTEVVKDNVIDPVNMIMMLRECAHSTEKDIWDYKFLAVAESYTPEDILDQMKMNRIELRNMVEAKIKDENYWADDYRLMPQLLPSELRKNDKNIDSTKWRNAYTSFIRGMNAQNSFTNQWSNRVVSLYKQYLDANTPEDIDKINDAMREYGWDIYIGTPTQDNFKKNNRINVIMNREVFSKITYYDLTEVDFPKSCDKSVIAIVDKLYIACVCDFQDTHKLYTTLYISDSPDFTHAVRIKPYSLSNYETRISITHANRIPFDRIKEMDILVLDNPDNTPHEAMKRLLILADNDEYKSQGEDITAKITSVRVNPNGFKLFLKYLFDVINEYQFNDLNLYRVFNNTGMGFIIMSRKYYQTLLEYIAMADSARKALAPALNETVCSVGKVKKGNSKAKTLGEIKKACKTPKIN